MFRGEEKSPTNPKDPRAELVDKLIWNYDPADYVLGGLFYLFFARSRCAQVLLPYLRILCKRNSGDACCHLSPNIGLRKAANR
jgi:hypothetical protein